MYEIFFSPGTVDFQLYKKSSIHFFQLLDLNFQVILGISDSEYHNLAKDSCYHAERFVELLNTSPLKISLSYCDLMYAHQFV